MPLVDRLAEKWREIREERLRGEESRRRVFESLSSQSKDRACREIAAWLKEADSSNQNDDDYYFQAQERIAGFRWQLYKLNRPFIWLEKQVIEPLNFWSDRADVFQFFSKISPVVEAIGVLAIPILIFVFENRREERQIRFEQNMISNQADVRKQQAVRDYLSQITTIYLDVEGKDDIDKDLRKLLRATTIAVLEELSISEVFQDGLEESEEFSYKDDRKGEVIGFLSELGWINSFADDLPLILLNKSNLSKANLVRANLEGADLRGADLVGANLVRANLEGADLRGADLVGANLRRANLEGADLRGADLEEIDLWGANLEEANLEEANLVGANLEETDLQGANLRGVDLWKVNLRGAYLREANLVGAYLDEVNLAEADLVGANLRGAYLGEVVYCQTIMPHRSIKGADCEIDISF